MVKFGINFLCIFLFLSPLSLANEAHTEAFLQKVYGQDLTKAPFFLRFDYLKKFDQDWSSTDYAERKAFLLDYETNSAAERAKERAEAKADAAKEKEEAREKKEEQRKIRDRLKAQLEKEKAEHRDDVERQKAMDEADKEQRHELQDMERLATQ